jgi:hypothetical protein
MKRTPIKSGLLLVVVLAVGLLGLSRRTNVPTDPEIRELIRNINPNNIFNTAQTLQNFGTRNSCSDQPAPGQGVSSARDFLFAQYSAIPRLQVRLDPFVHANCPNTPTFNVIAWLPGRNPNRLVIIGGHYDSRTTDVLDATSPAPGGNDSGAQSGVVLELARVMARHDFDATIVFMAFSGEEQGLFGSGEIAADLTRYFPAPQVIAMLNTDIPGGDDTANTPADLQNFRLYSSGIPRERLATDPDGTTDNTSANRNVMRYVGTWGGAYVPDLNMVPELREDRPGRASDHVSFINNGIPAVRIMERFECSPSPVNNSCGGPLPCPPPAQLPAFCKDTSFITTHQHSPNDLVQFITPPYAARIAQVIGSVAASLARAPDAPQNFNATGDSVHGIRVSFDEPATGHVDHVVVAARSVNENFYRQRVVLFDGDRKDGHRAISPQALGFNPGDSFYVSVASVSRRGHESLFSWPEVRCDSSSCMIPSYATAPMTIIPRSSPEFNVEDEK